MADQSQEGAFLKAVLTCIPSDSDQQQLVAEISRILKPGACLYLSDNLLNPDRRNQDRYEAQFLSGDFPFGVFNLPEGTYCRHHPEGHFQALFQDFEVKASKNILVTTMNGNEARARQMILQKK